MSRPAVEPALRETWIRPGGLRVSAGLAELWSARELLYFLVWRDVRVRYKQTVLGAGWALMQPLLMMVVFTLVFGRLAGLGSDGEPYPIYTTVALVPWNYFAAALNGGATSLQGNQHLLAKVYFPRLLMPLSAVLTPAVDASIAFLLVVALMLWYRVVPTAAVLWLPAYVVLAVVSAGAVATWLSALNIRYRDVRYVLPFGVQLWFFASPVVYAVSDVPGPWRTAYALNPMVSVVAGFRHALLGTPPPTAAMLAASVAAAAVGVVAAVVYFRRVEGTLVDLA